MLLLQRKMWRWSSIEFGIRNSEFGIGWRGYNLMKLSQIHLKTSVFIHAIRGRLLNTNDTNHTNIFVFICEIRGRLSNILCISVRFVVVSAVAFANKRKI